MQTRTKHTWFLLVVVLGLIVWGLVVVKQKLAAREARLRTVAEKKFEETKVTIVEGLTNAEVYASISRQGVGSATGFTEAEATINRKDYKILADTPSNMSLQGFLFPDTYRFAKNTTETAVLERLLNEFDAKFAEASSKVPTSAGYFTLPGYEKLTLKGRVAPGLTTHEIVTLAAIVEKETGRAGEPASSERLKKERQAVAGIFLNRLKIGQALQSDATVNYITKSGRASATTADTNIDSPYNTYKYPGLPPGPIANPSYSSLWATLHPAQSDYYYFLHAQPSGEIYYARTLDEHNQNKQKYLK